MSKGKPRTLPLIPGAISPVYRQNEYLTDKEGNMSGVFGSFDDLMRHLGEIARDRIENSKEEYIDVAPLTEELKKEWLTIQSLGESLYKQEQKISDEKSLLKQRREAFWYSVRVRYCLRTDDLSIDLERSMVRKKVDNPEE